VDIHVGGGARGEAEVVGESVAKLGWRGFCGVSVSRGGTGTVASIADSEPSEERFKERCE
jgi:hypothetical protein